MRTSTKSIAAFWAALLFAVPFAACDDDGDTENQQQQTSEDKNTDGAPNDTVSGNDSQENELHFKPITCGEAKSPELQAIEDKIIKYCDEQGGFSCISPRMTISLYADTGICQKELTALLSSHYDALLGEKDLDESLSTAYETCSDKAIAQCIKDNRLGDHHDLVLNYIKTSLQCLDPDITEDKLEQSVNSSVTTTYLTMISMYNKYKECREIFLETTYDKLNCLNSISCEERDLHGEGYSECQTISDKHDECVKKHYPEKSDN